MICRERQPIAIRKLPGRHVPHFDGLERRVAMALVASGPAILAIDASNPNPVPIALASPPRAFDVGFGQPIEAVSPASLDFAIRPIAADGSPAGPPVTLDPVEQPDEKGGLVITPTTLPVPGRYRLVLLGSSPLVDRLPPSSTHPARAADVSLATFEVASPPPVPSPGLTASAPASTTPASTTPAPITPAPITPAPAVVPAPAVSPTLAIDRFRLDRADPDWAGATGVTVHLAGPIATDPLAVGGLPAIVAIDDSGRSIALRPVGYDRASSELSFVFDRTLPAGAYALAVTGTGPSGTILGRFDQSPASLDPDDLGPLAPGTLAQGQVASVPLVAGAGSRELTVVDPGTYSFSGIPESARLAIRSEPTTVGRTGVEIAAVRVDDRVVAFLARGTYRLDLRGADPTTSRADLTLRAASLQFESYLGAGVGRPITDPLRILVGPDDGRTAASSPGPAESSTIVAPVPAVASPPEAPAPLLLLGAEAVIDRPIGRPSPRSSPIGVVAPFQSRGPSGLAIQGVDLPPGLLGPRRPARGVAPSPPSGGLPSSVEVAPQTAEVPGPTGDPGVAVAAASLEDEAEPRPIRAIDAELGPILGVAPPGAIVRLAERASGSLIVPDLMATDQPSLILAKYTLPILVTAAVVTIQGRKHRARRWSRPPATTTAGLSPPYRGPHAPTPAMTTCALPPRG